MSAPPSSEATIPVESVTVAGPGLTLLEPVVSTLSGHQEALMKIVTDLIAEKPKSPAEALELLGTLHSKIAEWVVSELPEKEAVLAGLKMAETLTTGIGCLPCFRK